MSDEFQDFPVVGEQLIQALEARYPDKMPMTTEKDLICHLQGQVSVVRLLKEVRELQKDNILSTTLE